MERGWAAAITMLASHLWASDRKLLVLKECVVHTLVEVILEVAVVLNHFDLCVGLAHNNIWDILA